MGNLFKVKTLEYNKNITNLLQFTNRDSNYTLMLTLDIDFCCLTNV